jgi:hypothetical protein
MPSPARRGPLPGICLSPPGISRPVRTLLLGSPPDVDGEAIKQDIKTLLQDRFGIAHSTLEFESGNHVHEDAKLYGH